MGSDKEALEAGSSRKSESASSAGEEPRELHASQEAEPQAGQESVEVGRDLGMGEVASSRASSVTKGNDAWRRSLELEVGVGEALSAGLRERIIGDALLRKRA